MTKKTPPRTHIGELKIGPDRYDIYEAPELHVNNDRVLGYCDYFAGDIVLDAGQKPARKRATLFHEALHAVSHEYGVGLTEKQVRRLETGLLNLLNDNPDLLK